MDISKQQFMKTKRCTQGFTLVELLVVISIIGIMSGMFVVAYRGAQQEANSQKTRLTVQKISDVITARMLEYENYSPPVGIPGSATPIVPPLVVSDRARLLDRAKLLLLREIIRTEMPDHPDDLKATSYWLSRSTLIVHRNHTGLQTPVPNSPGFMPVYVPASNLNPLNLTSRAANMYARLIQYPQWDQYNANAELLYLIVEDSELDGSSAIELFGASEIADTDNDGLNEFIDAFGRPINWIRWPSGYPQVGRSYPDMLDRNIVDSSKNVLIDADPYDRLKSDPGWSASNPSLKPGIYPRPLVVSAGQDGYFGLDFKAYDRYASGPLAPKWPAGATSLSVGDLPFPEALYGGETVRFSDPWGPRNAPAMRMGSYLVPGVDPREGGPNAPVTVPQSVASDNITNYEGAAVSL